MGDDADELLEQLLRIVAPRISRSPERPAWEPSAIEPGRELLTATATAVKKTKRIVSYIADLTGSTTELKI